MLEQRILRGSGLSTQKWHVICPPFSFDDQALYGKSGQRWPPQCFMIMDRQQEYDNDKTNDPAAL